MRDYQAVVATTVENLESGDRIAFAFTGNVDAGVINAVVDFPFQLTKDQRKYMTQRGLYIPEDENAPITSTGMRLLFGHFHSVGGSYKHMYVDMNRMVAVFPGE